MTRTRSGRTPQDAAVAELDKAFGNDPAAAHDVTVSDCAVVAEYGIKSTQATIKVTNPTDAAQSYSITVSVNDKAGTRIGEINAFANALAPGQSVTLSGDHARGLLSNESTKAGPAACTVASVNRFPS
ncbi:FxLYD domain-containing protein [Pseudonocardia sp.]|uniref:FxLYD domain-containing protein n=1 Tax=Pseudonocardia sp. TaxID=60912 RepID=UPI003D0CCEEC